MRRTVSFSMTFVCPTVKRICFTPICTFPEILHHSPATICAYGKSGKNNLIFFQPHIPVTFWQKLLRLFPCFQVNSAHDAYAVYEYCRRENIIPFTGLNPGHTGHFTYKDDFTIDDDGVPICKLGLRMHKDEYEAAKHRAKYRCPKANRKQGCFCGHPCSPAKYGRTVHIFTDDNPRLFNIPPRDPKA